MLGLCWDYVGTMLGLYWDYVGTMLGLSFCMQSNGGFYVQDAVIVKHMAYIEIYKKLIENADEIAKDIDTALNHPPKGGKRKRMKSGKN